MLKTGRSSVNHVFGMRVRMRMRMSSVHFDFVLASCISGVLVGKGGVRVRWLRLCPPRSYLVDLVDSCWSLL